MTNIYLVVFVFGGVFFLNGRILGDTIYSLVILLCTIYLHFIFATPPSAFSLFRIQRSYKQIAERQN